VVHAFAQFAPVESHVAGLHGTVLSGGQLPAPSQDAAWVSIPLAQLAVRHEVAVPGYVQPAVFEGAHAPEQGPPASPAHGARAPCGAPETPEHLP